MIKDSLDRALNGGGVRREIRRIRRGGVSDERRKEERIILLGWNGGVRC